MECLELLSCQMQVLKFAHFPLSHSPPPHLNPSQVEYHPLERLSNQIKIN